MGESAGDRARLRQVLRFHIPLGITTVMMATSHSVISSGLARTASPETALAAFAVAMTVTNLFASPLWGTREMLISLGTDRKSMHSGIVTTSAVGVFVLGWMLLLGYTRLGYTVYVTLFGASPELFPEIVSVVRLCALLPIIYASRSWSQALLMRARKAELMTVAMVARLVLMVVLAFWLPRVEMLSSTMVGGVIWVGGMAIESLVCHVFAMRGETDSLFEDLAPGESAMTVRDCLRFLWPMMINGWLGSLITPLINAGLARSADPERNLAVFHVVWGLVWMLGAFVHMTIRQTVLVFLKNRHWLRVLRYVTRGLQYVNSVVIVVMVAFGITDWILVSIIGLQPELLPDARVVLYLYALFPLLAGYVEFKTGLALFARRTGAICIARGVDVAALSVTIFVLTMMFPGLGAPIGAIAMMTGMSFYYLTLRKAIPDDDGLIDAAVAVRPGYNVESGRAEGKAAHSIE